MGHTVLKMVILYECFFKDQLLYFGVNFIKAKSWAQSKLMRLDRPPAKIRSKSNWNQLLIDFYDPNSAVQSIVATIWIRNPDYLDRF